MTAAEHGTQPARSATGPCSASPEPVGNVEIDEVLDALRDLHLLTPAQLVERYGEVHRSLQQILRTIDAA